MSHEQLRVRVEDELDAWFGTYPASGQSKGLVYGMVGPDGLIHSRGFGSIDDAGTPPDLDTVFPIASMTKSFVACAALIARDRGLVDLEAPIDDFFPEIPGGGSEGDPYAPPTLRMLLSMSGGLTEDNAWVDPLYHWSLEDLLAHVTAGLNYSHPPGSVYEYSNLGFTLAGLAVGQAVGQSIEDFVRDEIFVPLGLSKTWFDDALPDASTWIRGIGYSLNASAEWVPYPPVSSGAFAAAGGMQSTVRDLARWVRWLGDAFRPSISEGLVVLSRASRRELQRMHQIDEPSLTVRPDGSLRMSVGGYGLGLTVSKDLRRGTLVGHAGGVPGFKSYMCWHPDSGHGLVTLTNSHRGDPTELTKTALLTLLDRHDTPAKTITLWPETVELRRQAEELIRGWDDALAEKVFADNVAFDRPLAQRRQDIEDMVRAVGPLTAPRPLGDVTSAATPADITWTIQGERGELVCMVHLTPIRPSRIQEFEVVAVSYDRPRGMRPTDISNRRAPLASPSMNSWPNISAALPADGSTKDRIGH